ncbi:MAG TPA: HDIG domain-containing protein [Candidatus Limnocylindrales bacterium]|nr:HDIG domain-containing protein [Candidatus Limnocylindrales bacterium]
MSVIDRLVQTWRYAAVDDGDKRHAERTAEILRERGADADLILAGLLHDRAKPASTRLWHRVAAVLLETLAPALRRRFARGEGTFARYLDHARRGAEMARVEGRSERVVRLIARHHDAPLEADERLLARADREAMP